MHGKWLSILSDIYLVYEKNVILLKLDRVYTRISRILLTIKQDRAILQSRFAGTLTKSA
jgi:hypothetical protein